jgi:hypothetical protein
MSVAGCHFVAALLLAQSPSLSVADQPPSFPDQQTQRSWKRAEELARKGVDQLMQSLELFRESLPVYGAPYIDGNGNIVIPRRGPPPSGVPVPEPQPDRT